MLTWNLFASHRNTFLLSWKKKKKYQCLVKRSLLRSLSWALPLRLCWKVYSWFFYIFLKITAGQCKHTAWAEWWWSIQLRCQSVSFVWHFCYSVWTLRRKQHFKKLWEIYLCGKSSLRTNLNTTKLYWFHSGMNSSVEEIYLKVRNEFSWCIAKLNVHGFCFSM